MLLTKQYEELIYESKKYYVGQIVVANDCPPYTGLIGCITEIRDGMDKETDNPSPDIYCNFSLPENEKEKDEVIKRFSAMHGRDLKPEEINLDMVIMAPEMIFSEEDIGNCKDKVTIYLVEEDWAVDSDEEGSETLAFIDLEQAKLQFKLKLFHERKYGLLERWEGRDDLIEDLDDNSYEGYIDGFYCGNHYTLRIKPFEMQISEDKLNEFNKMALAKRYYKDFAEQVEDWEDTKLLTEQQYKDFINDPSIPERIETKQNEEQDAIVYYSEEYNRFVSEVAFELLEIHLKKAGIKK